VVKKYVGWECYQGILIVASKPRGVAKNYLLYRGSKSNFADEECYIVSAYCKT